MNKYNMKDYWEERAKKYGASSVLSEGLPKFYNGFFEYFQKRAINKILRKIGSMKGIKVLEVGCGAGRWLKFFHGKGAHVLGIDVSETMLRMAKTTKKELVSMSATSLGFRDRTFNLVVSITVLQHIPHNVQDCAIKEMSRVTKEGGHIIILESTNLKDKAPHMFPLSKYEWSSKFARAGCRLIDVEPLEYIPLISLASKFVAKMKKHKNYKSEKAKKTQRTRLFRKIFTLALRIVVCFSYPLEFLMRLFRPSVATHYCMLFVKEV